MHSKATKICEVLQVDFYFLRAKILLKMASTQSSEDEIALTFECRAAIDQAKRTCESYYGHRSEKLTAILIFENQFFLQ